MSSSVAALTALSIDSSILSSPIVVTPVSLIVTSPEAEVNVGIPEALPKSIWPPVGAEVTLREDVPLPYTTPFDVNVPTPVPPRVTLRYCSDAKVPVPPDT